MDFHTRIDNDLKEAMKGRQSDRLSVIRMLKSALKNAVIEKGGNDALLDPSEVAAVVRKEVKKRQDAIEGFVKGNRPELAEKERAELEVLTAYLPQPLTSSELDELVSACIAETGASSKAQMGAVMKCAQERSGGRADGKALSAAVSARLA
jgi:uncharacterized protein YqeY